MERECGGKGLGRRKFSDVEFGGICGIAGGFEWNLVECQEIRGYAGQSEPGERVDRGLVWMVRGKAFEGVNWREKAGNQGFCA